MRTDVMRTRVTPAPLGARPARGLVHGCFYLVAVGGALLFVLPLFWTIVWSSWDTASIFSFPPKFAPGPDFVKNLTDLRGSLDIWRVTFNSVVVSVIGMVGALFFCSLAGFAFAKYRFRGRTVLFYLLLATMAVPGWVTVVPLFVIMLRLNWVNTYQGLIIPGLIPAFGVFLMRQSIEQGVPDELLDAARIDGAGELRIFLQVVLPVMLPNLAALAIFLFAGSWNNLFWPLVMARTADMYTLPVALATLLGQYSHPYGQVMFGSLIMVVPPLVLFLTLQRYFIQGLVVGAVKA
jgi:lactose/L-arabinose transport system permease protein